MSGATESVGTVGALWRYPVKSLQGSPADRVEVGPNGVDHDRRWGIVDVENGKVLSAKRSPALLEASGALDDEGGVLLTLPDGKTWSSHDPDTNGALSSWLDRDVELRRSKAGASTPYELTMDPTDDSSEPWDFATPQGSFADLAAVHVLTTASLAAIAASYEEGRWDVLRFRPTALVDTDSAEGFVEDGWVGGQVRLGGVEIDVFMQTPRCAMPGRGQGPVGLDRDKKILTTLRDEHENNLGVYASVVTPGSVAVGDPVGRT